jgi:hypothetical protein
MGGGKITDEYQNLDSNGEAYEETRKRLRYGPFESGLLIFVSTVGLGIFTY